MIRRWRRRAAAPLRPLGLSNSGGFPDEVAEGAGISRRREDAAEETLNSVHMHVIYVLVFGEPRTGLKEA